MRQRNVLFLGVVTYYMLSKLIALDHVPVHNRAPIVNFASLGSRQPCPVQYKGRSSACGIEPDERATTGNLRRRHKMFQFNKYMVRGGRLPDVSLHYSLAVIVNYTCYIDKRLRFITIIGLVSAGLRDDRHLAEYPTSLRLLPSAAP